MPGIYGLSMQHPDLTPSLNAMREAMLLYPHFQQDELFVDQRCGASRVHLGKIGQKQTPYTGDNGCRVWIEGEVYNLPEILPEFGWAGPKTDSDSFPIWLLHAYEEGKLDAFLNRVDGYFCAAIYDPTRKKVFLVSDRYGMRMLYWYHRDGLFAWSSEVKGILAIDRVDRTIDATTLPCFMDLGYLMGEHTWFEHIKLIKPATILEYDIDAKKLTQRYYWTWGEIKPSELSFDEAVDALHEIFMESVRRRFDPNERIGISLSGGLDSRAIFAAVNKLYPDYEGYAYTFGIPNCDDIRIAKQVVTHSNWRHEVFYFSSHNWFHPREEMVWNTDGMMDIMHMHGGEFSALVCEKIDVNLNGYLGDVICGGSWIGAYPKNARSNFMTLQNAYKDYAELAGLQDIYFDLDDVAPRLYASRARRFTNLGSVNGLIRLEQRKPFFDNSVIEWAHSTPEYYRESNKIYSEMLQRYYPEYFKDIPWQRTGMPAGAVSRTPINLSIRTAKKLLRIAKAHLGIRASQGYTDYAQWIREPEIADELTQLLSASSCQYRQLTTDDYEQAYLMPHLNSRGINKSNQILRAATVELYMRRVLYKQ